MEIKRIAALQDACLKLWDSAAKGKIGGLSFLSALHPLQHEIDPIGHPIFPAEKDRQREFSAKVRRCFKDFAARAADGELVEALCRLARDHQRRWYPALPCCDSGECLRQAVR